MIIMSKAYILIAACCRKGLSKAFIKGLEGAAMLSKVFINSSRYPRATWANLARPDGMPGSNPHTFSTTSTAPFLLQANQPDCNRVTNFFRSGQSQI